MELDKKEARQHARMVIEDPKTTIAYSALAHKLEIALDLLDEFDKSYKHEGHCPTCGAPATRTYPSMPLDVPDTDAEKVEERLRYALMEWGGTHSSWIQGKNFNNPVLWYALDFIKRLDYHAEAYALALAFLEKIKGWKYDQPKN